MNLLKPLVKITATVSFVIVTAAAAKEMPLGEMCEFRASLMGSVAQERDNGRTREQVKKKIPAKFKEMLPWVDMIYDKMQGMKPQEVANLVKYSCLQNKR